MLASQQAENCLGIRLVWDIIQEKTTPADRDFALHAVGKDLVERNADVYHEALTNAEILCDMFANVVTASDSASTLIQTMGLYPHFGEHEALLKEVVDLLKQSGPEKRALVSRSKSQARRLNEVAEAYHKQEKFKASKVVQRILSSKTVKTLAGQADAKHISYVSDSLFATSAPSTVGDTPSTLHAYTSHLPSLEEAAPALNPIPSSPVQVVPQVHTLMKDSGNDNSDGSDEDEGDVDFYAIDSPPTRDQSGTGPEKQPEPEEQVVDPPIYDASTLRELKLTASDYTGEFIIRVRSMLEIEYNYLLKKVEKIQNTITNTAKVSEVALAISQELVESAKSLTEADLIRLRGIVAHQAYDQDTGGKSAKPPLLQENRSKQLLASPTHSMTTPLAGSMSTLKCLPKIGK
ncbi:hypothetical protein GL50803_0016700 [Giardia duodenalis]|uniref:Uncharacterized protein n=1 Tax=Giardia intestinalis (strain ATCC 50803 / WB clone C6) TaxID=184922 RepID=A8BI89_GIAIC|nr:hypothetical protein GL50803_0016700 [Giardia intestinalis]KAE8305676.1 hypothetical protein GL50803_0016700 [Giardia intestinalis]|eukprot:XP_001706794.1 Hypothetical protein GL50803_16700 [Giardia lamblia ATCC 50803]